MALIRFCYTKWIWIVITFILLGVVCPPSSFNVRVWKQFYYIAFQNRCCWDTLFFVTMETKTKYNFSLHGYITLNSNW